jgi:hypothetical protein
MLGELFEVNLTTMITPRVVRVLYVLGMAMQFCACAAWVISRVASWAEAGWHVDSGMEIVMVFGAPFAFVLGVLVLRLFAEGALVLFRIEEHLSVIRQR